MCADQTGLSFHSVCRERERSKPLFMGLNEGGFVTGSYATIAPGPPGPGLENICTALYALPRSYLQLPVPGADSTTAAAINDSNVMTGWSDSKTNPGGFLRLPDVP